MELIINGEREEGDFSSLSALLAGRELDPAAVVVELNGQILPKAEYGRPLKDGDALEIVHFVAGG